MRQMFFLFPIYLCLMLSLVNCSSETATRQNEKATPAIKKQSAKADKKPVKVKEVWPKRGKIKEYFTKYGAENPETHVMLKTTFGDIEIELFEDTPLHRANFIHHIKRGLYYRTIFYRVVPDFIIQGGNSDNDKTRDRRKEVDSYYIPNEVKSNRIHQRGALAAAMTYQNNPENNSSQYDWYIVIGKVFSRKELDATAVEYEMDIPEWRREIYTSVGGTPHLDGKHTVFGRVLSGMNAVEEISKLKRDGSDWPINDVIIDYEILD